MTELITGNTFPVKGELRAMGGTWDARAKGWRVPAERASEARELVAGVPRERPAPRRGRSYSGRSYGSSYTRFQGGAEVYTNARGRCEDAPCCGCCS
jgi:hypothetical protein